MIAFFPEIYPDELLYSQFARYYARTGYARYVFVVSDLYKNESLTMPSIEFVNKFTDDAMHWITKTEPWEIITEQHTMYPAYIRFLPLERRKEAVNSILSCNGNWKKHMCLPVLNEKRYLRYCPECAKEDRAIYGEAYWHREHQLPRIQICQKHGCYLENSDVLISSKTSPGLFDAETHVPIDKIIRKSNNSKEIEFTKYFISVFQTPIDAETDFSIGSYLHDRLDKKYKNQSGLVRNISKLYEDYRNFFVGMPLMTESYLHKIFNGHVYDPYFILQLSFFLNISVSDITHLPCNKIKGLEDTYQELALKYEIDYKIISEIGSKILKKSEYHSNISRSSETRKELYKNLDVKYYPLVKKAVDDIIKKDGRPEKVSITKIQRYLGLPQKQLKKLPKCKAYIDKHCETQEQFWAREVGWAINELNKENKQITLSKILKLTNMRKRDIESCIPFLNDKDIPSIIEQLQYPHTNIKSQENSSAL